MTELIKVKDHPGLFRDPVSKAIVVDDPLAKKNYQMQRNTLTRSLGATEELKNEISNIKDEINSIKSVLYDISRYLKSNQ